MPAPERPKPFLKVDELRRRSDEAVSPKHRRQWKVIHLMATAGGGGARALLPASQVAQLTGYSRTWVRQLVRRYNRRGPEGFIKQKESATTAKPCKRGRPRILSDETQAALAALLASDRTPEGQPWNALEVQAWLENVADVYVAQSTAWRYLQRLTPPERNRRLHIRVGDDVYVDEAEYFETYRPLLKPLHRRGPGRPKKMGP